MTKMKVLIDTNIIIDVLCNRSDFCDTSAYIFKLCEIRKITGIISALSAANIIYIMRRELNALKIKDILNMLFTLFTVEDLKSIDLIKVANLNFRDYEDALQSLCAVRAGASYIITRNIKDFKTSKVPAVKPEDFIITL